MLHDVRPVRNNRKGFLPPTYVKETDPYLLYRQIIVVMKTFSLAKDNSNYLVSVCNYQKYYYGQRLSVKRFRIAAMLCARARETTLLHLLTIWDAKKDTLFPKYRTRRRNKLKLEKVKSLMETGQQRRKLISTLNIPEVKRIKVVEVLFHGRYFENL